MIRERRLFHHALPALAPRPPVAQWAERICARWSDTVEGIFDVGRLLIGAKAELEHGEWQQMCETRLPFAMRTAQRLMAIANDERLLPPHRGSLLPPSWRTLYELTTLDDDTLAAAFADGLIKPDMDRAVITTQRKAARRAARERALAAKIHKLPEKKYGVILADPEWAFEPWSDVTGMDRAAANHYPTSPIDAIIGRDVAAIAADDCVLFLWATVPMLSYALAVIEGWGFSYKSHCVWFKDRPGTGYWFRNTHELLLIGTRGKLPAPTPGTQWSSVIDATRRDHSRKPDIFLDMIEAYFPTLPKIELNRRGPARPGWDAWGNEAEPANETAPSPPALPPDTPVVAAPAPVASPDATGAPVGDDA